MTRSFGDRVAASVGTICCPEIKEFELKEEDKFMILASDGVWEFIDSEESVHIVKKFYENGNAKEASDELVKKCREIWDKQGKEVDDITAVVIFFSIFIFFPFLR